MLFEPRVRGPSQLLLRRAGQHAVFRPDRDRYLIEHKRETFPLDDYDYSSLGQLVEEQA